MSDTDDRKAFTTAGAARYADRSVSTMRAACKHYGLRHQKVGSQVVIFKVDLDEWLSRPDVMAMRRHGEQIRSKVRAGIEAQTANA
jgi:hypothetical protein